MAASNVHHLNDPFQGLSIQGEKESRQIAMVFMEDDDVDAYVNSVSDAVIACRERGRHLFPPMRTTGLVFTEVTDDGLFVRRLECMCCHLVDRVEFWETRGSGKNRRYVPVAARPDYKRGPNGERYLAKSGNGRMTAKMVRSAIASQILQGTTPSTLMKQIKEQDAKRREQEAQRRAS